MSVRTWSIRSRLIALVAVPTVCLVFFWGFANYLTVGAGLRLYNQGALVDQVAVPAENVLTALQGERRASMVYLASPGTENRTTLTAARRTVDKKIETYRTGLASDSVQSLASDQALQLARGELSKLDKLPKLRSQVDSRTISGARLMASAADMVDDVLLLRGEVARFPDDATAAEGRSLQSLARARELRSREDAVLAAALAAGHFTTSTYQMFVQAVAVQRFGYHLAYAAFTAQDKREYDNFTAQAPFPELAAMERTALDDGRSGKAVPVNDVQWQQDNSTALNGLSHFGRHLDDILAAHAKTPTNWVYGRLIGVLLLGVIALVASILVARRATKALVRQLRGLRDSARDLAWVRLPAVVDRLTSGERVDVDGEVPALPAGRDEIGQLSESFNEVGRTAVRSATEQAALRAGIANVFLNIARRSQTLLHRQISHLDVMERKAAEPEALEDLFRIDHLATRMRRNAENLVILGGGQPGRKWHRPVPLIDVLRSASSEVEQYDRVRVLPFPEMMLAGSVVSDVVHLAAELIDNAAAFSPPHTRVQVTGQSVSKGFAVEIEDRGLGMSKDDLSAANGWLARPPEFDVLALSDNARLGMFVVARIAARHGIKVHLRGSPYGGTTAIILLPHELVAEAGQTEELSARDTVRAEAEGTPADEVLTDGGGGVQEPSRAPVLVSAGAPDSAGPESWPRLSALPGRPDPGESEVAPPRPRRMDLDESEVASRRMELDESEVAPPRPRRMDLDESDLAPPRPRRTEETGTGSGIPSGSTSPDDGFDRGRAAGDGAPNLGDADISALPPLPPRSRTGQHRAPGDRRPAPGPHRGAEPRHTVESTAPEQPPQPDRPRPAAPTSGGPVGSAAQFGGPADSAARSGGPADGAARSGGPAGSAGQSGDGGTHLGLPKRVRQANLAPGLRAAPPEQAPAPEAPALPQRSPEEIRRMMSSYQRGTVRGRESEVRPEDSAGDGPSLGAPPQATTNLTTVEVGREDG